MKRTNILIVMFLFIAGLIAIPGCNKDDAPTPQAFKAPMPEVSSPGNEGVVTYNGATQSVELTWTGTGTDAPKWEVYFGDSDDPALVASNVTTNSYTVNVTTGGTYYWRVISVDSRNIQSKSPVWSFQVNSSPAAPNTPAPALNATKVSCNPTLTWKATDPQEDALTYDVYLGKTATPALYASNLSEASLAITATLTANTDYYWKVVAHDPYGGVSESPVWKFTTGDLPIMTFTGNYTADEPAEAYTYDISFAFATAATIKTTNYWNSGWTGVFTLDFTKLTYSMPLTAFTTSWSAVEAGIIDPATGTMTGTYTIWYKGAIAEQGVHTYTKK